MASRRPKPSLTDTPASWSRQRQEARGGTLVARAEQKLYISCFVLLIPLAVSITNTKTGGEEGRTKEMIPKNDLHLRYGLLSRLRPPSEQILYIDVQSSIAAQTLTGYARVRQNHMQTLIHKRIIISHYSFPTPRALITPFCLQSQRQQRSAHPLPKYRQSHSPTDPSRPSR